MIELAPGLVHIDLGLANVVLVEPQRPGEELALIDAGAVGMLERLAAALARRGRDVGELRRVLVTHGHMDHVGGLAELAAEVHAASGRPLEVWVHRSDAPFVRGEAVAPRPDPAGLPLRHRLLARLVARPQPPAPVTRELAGREALPEVRPGLRVVHLPGHSPGQVGYLFEPEGVLVGGDVAMRLLPWLHPPLRAYTADMPAALASAAGLVGLPFDTLALGHGRPIRGGAQRALARYARRHRLAPGPRSADTRP